MMEVRRSAGTLSVAALALLAVAAVVTAVFSLARHPEPTRAAIHALDSSLFTTRNVHNGSSPTSVFVSDQDGYAFYVDADGSCAYSKTTDGGASWGSAVVVDAQTDCIRVAVWYDQWTPGDLGTLIHVATIDTGDSDMSYTALDTSDDSLTATANASGIGQSSIFTINKSIPSITKGTDGDLYMGVQDTDDSYVIKCAGTCTDGANWAEAGTNPFDLTNDWLILMPLPGDDVLAIRWDISAGDVQSKVYDDGTDSWDGAWTDIDADAPVDTVYDAPFGATLNPDDGTIYLAYAAQTDVMGTDDDIRTASYSGGTWTAGADALTDDAKGITGVKAAFDSLNGRVYVLYAAQTTPGTLASANIYSKRSDDAMASWGSEQGPHNDADKNFFGARVNLVSDERLFFAAFAAGSDNLLGDTLSNLGVSSGGSSVQVLELGSATGKPGITLLSPNGGEALGSGTRFQVEWTTRGRVDFVDLSYSLDDGATWLPIELGVPNSGTRAWTVPGVGARAARVRAEATDTVVSFASDASDLPFTLLGEPPAAPGASVPSPFTGLPEQVDPVALGDYLRSPHYRGIFFVGDAFVRRPFADAATFFTYEPDLARVREVTDATLSTLPAGIPMPPKPLTTLVRFGADEAAFLPVPGPTAAAEPLLRRLDSEEAAVRLFGADWESFVLPLDPSQFAFYAFGAPLLGEEALDVSGLVPYADLQAKVREFLEPLTAAGYRLDGRLWTR